MSFFYRADISYNGTRYFGWQVQGPKDQITIQGTLERAMAQVSGGAFLKSIGSGRTDAKVHALHQIVRLEFESEMDCSRLLRGANSLLPSDIRINDLVPCTEDFHPILKAQSKTYKYYFARDISPFDVNFIAPAPRDLDIDKMREGIKYLIGVHDFKNFFCVGTPVKSTEREIFGAELIKVTKHDFLRTEDVYLFKIIGSGFLKQMVRLIVGSLWQLGRGRISLQKFQDAVDGKIDGKVGPVAPPEGLYLTEVKYHID